jgi:hypothetical protein
MLAGVGISCTQLAMPCRDSLAVKLLCVDPIVLHPIPERGGRREGQWSLPRADDAKALATRQGCVAPEPGPWWFRRTVRQNFNLVERHRTLSKILDLVYVTLFQATNTRAGPVKGNS